MIVRLLALVAAIVPVVGTGTALADQGPPPISPPPIAQCYSLAVTGGPEVTVCQP